MKKSIFIASFLAAATLLLARCSANEETLFDPQFSYVAFVDENDKEALANENPPVILSYSKREDNQDVLKIPVGASGRMDESLLVNFTFTIVEGSLYREAVEGVDFTLLNASKTLAFPNGAGVDTIYIQAINNQVKNGHSIFRIMLEPTNVNYKCGFNNCKKYADVMILDDESMSKFEGDWVVSGYTVHYYDKNKQLKQDFDTSSVRTIPITPYTVTIASHAYLEDVLVVRNFMKEGALSAEVYIDETSGEISMAAYQVLGTIKGYDILLFTFDNNGDDLGPATPVEGRVIDDNTLSIWHYSAFYYNTSGQEVGVGPGYDILKSTWKRKK